MRNSEIGPPTGRNGTANRLAAQAWLDGILAEEAEGNRRTGDLTVEELANAYLVWCRGQVAERTVKGYSDRLTAFCAEKDSRGRRLGGRLARDLRSEDCEFIVRRLKQIGAAPTWVRDVVVTAKVCCAWGSRSVPGRSPERLLSGDPLIDAKGPKVPAPPKRYAGAVARSEFFAACLVRLMGINPEREPMTWRFDRLTVAFWRFCDQVGARPDEACRLEWEHIDWKNGVAVLKGKTTEATGKSRRLPLSTPTLRLLRAIQALPGRHQQFVFTHMRRDGKGTGDLAGVPWNTNSIAHKFSDWRDEFAAYDAENRPTGIAVERAGTQALTIYQFRRDLGARVLRMTGSHAESAEVLGHSSVVNERYYASFEASRATDIVNRLNKEDH